MGWRGEWTYSKAKGFERMKERKWWWKLKTQRSWLKSKMTSLDFQYLKSRLTPFQGRGGTFTSENWYNLCSASCGWATFASRVVPEDLYQVLPFASSSERWSWWKPFGHLVDDNSDWKSTIRGNKIYSRLPCKDCISSKQGGTNVERGQ